MLSDLHGNKLQICLYKVKLGNFGVLILKTYKVDCGDLF